MRTVNLSRIAVQLVKPDLLKICKVLEAAKSQYLSQFQELAQQIKNKTDEADDNLKHLKELEEPCGKLKEALPKDIPKMLPLILKCVRNVYQHS